MNKEEGFSLIELLILVAVILIIAAIAIPNLLKAKMSANEASTAATLRVLCSAETIFSITYSVGYTEGLHRLGPPALGAQPSVIAADLVDATLSGQATGGTDTTFTKSGYIFTYAAPGAFGAITLYTINADPTARGGSGIKSFFTNNPQVIRYNIAAPAGPNDTPL